MIKCNVFKKRSGINKVSLKNIVLCMVLMLAFFYGIGFVFHTFASPSNEEEVKEKLTEILSELDSGESESDNKDSFFRKKIIEFIQWLFKKIDPSKLFQTQNEIAIPEGASGIMKIVAIGLILFILGLICYFIFRNFKKSRRVMMDEDAEILNTIHDPDIIISRVQQYIEAGDYSQALRFLYIAMLISFNKLNIIRINKAKTNKQYLLEIESNKPQVYSIVVNFTNDFNRYWYGKKELSKTKFESLYQSYSTIIETEGLS